jgi:hypothetical protein
MRVVVKAKTWAAAVAAWAAMASVALAQEGPKPAQIDRNGVLILIRETMLALDQANKTGNYTVLRDLGSPAFQQNNAARLGEIEPQLSLLPQIEPNGLLHMTGFFPSAPEQINFDVAYAPVNGQWRLFGISVGLAHSGPAAPQAPPPAAAAPAPKPKSDKKPGAKTERRPQPSETQP